MRSHNVQFLPVQWRTTLKLDEDEARKRKMDGLDNSFSLADITLKKHIPWVAPLMGFVVSRTEMTVYQQNGARAHERGFHRHTILHEVSSYYTS